MDGDAMTDSTPQAEPRTVAGRTFVNRSGPRTNRAERLRVVLAIEAEAAQPKGLDVERLARAMVECQVDVAGMGRFGAIDVAREVAAEYARLTEKGMTA